MARHLLRMNDLSDADIETVLSRADELAAGGPSSGPTISNAATIFLTSSLRTRVGFAVAARRLGAGVVDVQEMRDDDTMSVGESFEDTLRTVSGMVDLIITRVPFDLGPEAVASAVCPVINAGDAVEHPSQALIDISAIRTWAGPVDQRVIGICGDLSMRAVTSLLELLARTPPQRLLLFSPPSRRGATEHLPDSLAAVTSCSDTPEVRELDVLYLPGLPQSRGSDVLASAQRAKFAFGPEMAQLLPDSAVVLSPLPVIDEIEDSLRGDPRIKMFEQSDRGVFVRMALMEWVAGH